MSIETMIVLAVLVEGGDKPRTHRDGMFWDRSVKTREYRRGVRNYTSGRMIAKTNKGCPCCTANTYMFKHEVMDIESYDMQDEMCPMYPMLSKDGCMSVDKGQCKCSLHVRD